jgi:leucyl aminopeptidase
MKFTVKSEKPASVKSGCVVLGVFEKRKLSDAAARFDKTTRGLLTRLLHDGEMDGSCGQTRMVHYPRSAACERVCCWWVAAKRASSTTATTAR